MNTTANSFDMLTNCSELLLAVFDGSTSVGQPMNAGIAQVCNSSFDANHSLDDIGSTASTSPSAVQSITLGRLALCCFMFAVVFISFLANFFVVLSFVVEKRLRTTFTSLIANLAVTDMLVAILAMDFYTVNLLFGYWPFGKVLCGIWVLFDYTTVFSSSWSLAGIAIDRCWSIKWSISYRRYNRMKKAVVMIAIIWASVMAIVFYPIISDRVLHTRDHVCEYVPAENPRFVIALAVLGHHFPCFTIIFCTSVVYYEMKKLSRLRPGVHPANGGGQSTLTSATVKVIVHPVGHQSEENEAKNIALSHRSGSQPSSKNTKKPTHNEEASIDDSTDGAPRTTPAGGAVAPAASVAADAAVRITRHERERRTFITLAYIVLCYVVCWVPFHVIYDLSMVYQNDPPLQAAFNYYFWITYVNSTLNPFLYAFSSAELRKVFMKLVFCRR